ncbi:sugar-binding transcriptional regulator [Aliifodinibius sp. S!AR15-10]|uniref:sugar-binding transcriptional regulator n=1 Tax=Aliifodinibius sp. S!AR15-10 TaxID=2950437 RepID=UPI00286FE7C4|nr:sugar-binding transcriptional regulator [Aliifodinibius sp. S!AR15-10]
MPKNRNSIDVRLLSKVSALYYEQDYNQQEIATRLQLSRPKVSRLLKRAREKGIVQISIVTPNSNFVELENALEKRFGLKEVVLVEADEKMSAQTIKRQLGSAAAEYLHRTIKVGDLIGVTWGTTLQAMLDAMQPKSISDLHVVQALGGVGAPEAKAHAADISRRLSQALDARLTLLPAPGIVGSVEAKEVLLNDRQVKSTVEKFSQIDTLYVGLGALHTNPVLTKDTQEISEEVCDEVMNSEAVGDIALRFFDINGNEVDTTLKDLVIGVSPEEMMAIDTVVGIAGGQDKAEVIHGALNGKNIDVLISDSLTARRILEG